jgi:hypothetical protein
MATFRLVPVERETTSSEPQGMFLGMNIEVGSGGELLLRCRALERLSFYW